MKKIISAFGFVAMLLITSRGFASELPFKKESKTVFYQLGFSNLIIEDNINVILTESLSKQIDVTGAEKDIAGLNWNIKNGTMVLSSKKKEAGSKITVTLYIQGLKSINVFGNSIISSLGPLTTPVSVYLNGEACLAISSKAPIHVFRDYEVEFTVKNATGNVNIY